MIILPPEPYRLGILRLLSNPRVYWSYLTTTRRNLADDSRQSGSTGPKREKAHPTTFPSETDKPDVQEWQCAQYRSTAVQETGRDKWKVTAQEWEAPGFDPVVQCGELIGQSASGARRPVAMGRRCRPIAADSATTCASDWSGASGRSTV